MGRTAEVFVEEDEDYWDTTNESGISFLSPFEKKIVLVLAIAGLAIVLCGVIYRPQRFIFARMPKLHQSVHAEQAKLVPREK